RPRAGDRAAARHGRCAHARVDGRGGAPAHAHRGARDVLVAQPARVLAKGRHLGPHPGGARRAHRLRRRRGAARGRPDGRRVPHGHAHVLRRPRARPASRCRDRRDARAVTDAAGGWAARRGRSASVVAILVGAAGALISSTQTWASAEVASAPIASSGADALPLLQPLALAALALSLALALTGRVVRVILAAVALLIGAGIAVLSIPVATTAPVSAVESV